MGTDKETSMETNGRQEESFAIEQPRRVMKSILCQKHPGRRTVAGRGTKRNEERRLQQGGDGRDTNEGLGNVYGPKAPEGPKA